MTEQKSIRQTWLKSALTCPMQLLLFVMGVEGFSENFKRGDTMHKDIYEGWLSGKEHPLFAKYAEWLKSLGWITKECEQQYEYDYNRNLKITGSMDRLLENKTQPKTIMIIDYKATQSPFVKSYYGKWEVEFQLWIYAYLIFQNNPQYTSALGLFAFPLLCEQTGDNCDAGEWVEIQRDDCIEQVEKLIKQSRKIINWKGTEEEFIKKYERRLKKVDFITCQRCLFKDRCNLVNQSPSELATLNKRLKEILNLSSDLNSKETLTKYYEYFRTLRKTINLAGLVEKKLDTMLVEHLDTENKESITLKQGTIVVKEEQKITLQKQNELVESLVKDGYSKEYLLDNCSNLTRKKLTDNGIVIKDEFLKFNDIKKTIKEL